MSIYTKSELCQKQVISNGFSFKNKCTIGVILESNRYHSDNLSEMMSIIGNLLNKAKFDLLCSGKIDDKMDILVKSFYYSGGEVELITSNYMLLTGQYFPYTIDLCYDKKQLYEKLIDKSDIFIVISDKIAIIKNLLEARKPIYLLSCNGQSEMLNSSRQNYMNAFSEPMNLVNHLNKVY